MGNLLEQRPKTKKDIEAKTAEAIKSAKRMMSRGATAFIMCAFMPSACRILFSIFNEYKAFDGLVSAVFGTFAIPFAIQFGFGVFMRIVAPFGYEPLPPKSEVNEKLDFLSAKYPEVKHILMEWRNSEVGLLDGDLTRIENFITKTSPAISGEHPAIRHDVQTEQPFGELPWRIKSTKEAVKIFRQGHYNEN